MATCGSGRHTVANGTWKKRPVHHKHLSMKIWTNISVHQKIFFLKRIKTHLLIYHSQRTQSSSWQVSLTCFTHLQKQKPVCKLRLWMSQEVLVSSHNHMLDLLDFSLQSGEEKKIKYKHCQLMPEVTFKKKKRKKRKPVAINGKISRLSEVWNSRHCLACLQFSGFRNWGCSSLGVWKNPVKWTVTVGSLTLRNTQKFSLTIADGIQHTSSKD